MHLYLADAARRGLRTFLQAFLGVLLAGWAGLALAPGDLPTWETGQRLLIAAAVAGTIALLTFIMNALEDNTKFPALLKAPPSPGRNPTP